MSKKTILVTGGAGFIGFHVARSLLERGDHVVIVDNFNDYYDPKIKEARIQELNEHKNLRVYKADISDYNRLEEIFQKNKLDKICHLAAQAGVRHSIKDPFRYEKWNNLGTLNLLELAKKYLIKDFVFASSSSVYGGNKNIPFSESEKIESPVSLYAATKKTNELYAHVYHHLFGLNCTGLRFFTVYGPWGRPDMALFKFVNNILKGKPIDVYNFGKMERDFTYISDIVFGVLAALDKPFPFEIFNLGNNNPIELMEFIKIIENDLQKKAKVNLLPIQPGDVPKTYANINKAKKYLNYNPKVNIHDGIKEFIKWYKSNSY